MIISVLVACSFIAVTIMFISPLAVIIGSALGTHIYVNGRIDREGVAGIKGVEAGLRVSALSGVISVAGAIAAITVFLNGPLNPLLGDAMLGGIVTAMWVIFGLAVGIPVSLVVSPLVAMRAVRKAEARLHRERMEWLASPAPPARNVDPWS